MRVFIICYTNKFVTLSALAFSDGLIPFWSQSLTSANVAPEGAY